MERRILTRLAPSWSRRATFRIRSFSFSMIFGHVTPLLTQQIWFKSFMQFD